MTATDTAASIAEEANPKPYRTSDMYVAAYLMYAKATFVKVEKEKNAQGKTTNRSFFYFERTPGFDKLVAEYFNGKGLVPANDFAAKIRDVKTLTHSG